MNKIVLSFLYLCNLLGTLLVGSSLISMAINNRETGLFLMFCGIEVVILVITLVYVILYSKKLNK